MSLLPIVLLVVAGLALASYHLTHPAPDNVGR